MQGSWYRCCGGRIRKLWDCCAYSSTRINGDAALTGYCYGGRRKSARPRRRRPRGLAVDAAGSVYVADTLNDRIQVFDSQGNFLRKWGSRGSGNGQFYGPSGLAVDAAGSVYVADAGNGRIQVFDSQGHFLRKWGSGGSGNG